jgi:hypothetical protein
MLRRAMMLLCAAFISGCTVIEVHGAQPSTSYHFGVLRIAPAPEAGSVAYRARGVGFVPGLNGLTFGYRREDAVLVVDPNDCRLVVFDAAEGASTSAAGAVLQDVCHPGG